MKILVVAATNAEIQPLADYFKLSQGELMLAENFDIIITGVGMTATAYALGKHLSKKYNLVLNLGIAGSFNTDLPLGTLVNITSDQFAELGAEDNEHFIPIDQLGFGKSTYQGSYSNQFLQLIQGRGITVNRVHGNALTILSTKERFNNPLIESMEGAAVFYCCEKENIPCLQVRAISNYVEPRNRANWQIGLAIQQLNTWAISFLTNP